LRRGIYIHIPFCLSKCAYCGFSSFPCERFRSDAPYGEPNCSEPLPSPQGVPEWYLDAVAADARTEARLWDGVEFETLYLGGGTPSLLRPEQLGRVLGGVRRHFRLVGRPEISVECNPNTVDAVKLEAFRSLGVSRVSIGVQSLVDSELAVLGRRHSSSEALSALKAARAVGFGRVSADIMIGIPGQTRAGLDRTLGGVLDLADHVSGYMLTLEHGTRLEALVRRGELRLPDDDAMLSLYRRACRVIEGRGLARYEISNWSRPGHECIHNQIYWQRGEYAGLGAGAHSHRAGRRYAKNADPEAYAERLDAGLDAVEMSEDLSEDEKLLEAIMLGLRTSDGIDMEDLVARYRLDIKRTRPLLEDLAREGYIIKDGSNLLLSTKGICVQETVSELLATAVGRVTA
jgi:oxygen-independent coproporphyrinogen-3 oxidase